MINAEPRPHWPDPEPDEPEWGDQAEPQEALAGPTPTGHCPGPASHRMKICYDGSTGSGAPPPMASRRPQMARITALPLPQWAAEM
jgi:hypothetical protein